MPSSEYSEIQKLNSHASRNEAPLSTGSSYRHWKPLLLWTNLSDL